MRRRLRDLPLSLRLTALYVAILAAVLGVLGFVLYSQVAGFVLRDTTDRLERAAASGIVRETGPRHDADDDTDNLRELLVGLASRDVAARVLAADGSVLANGAAFDGQPVPPDVSAEEMRRAAGGQVIAGSRRDGDAHQLVLLLPLQLGKGSVGALELTASLAATDGLLARLRLILLFGTLGAIGLGTLLGVSVTRVALRPLARVTATSERIAAGDLGQRTNLSDGRDEIGRLAGAFDHMVDRLEGALHDQRRFVADASHELRTPLTALGGLIEMLLLGADRGDIATTQRALRTAHREVERLARLVGDLLTLSRLDARPDAAYRPVDLAALVAEVGEQARFLAGTRAVTWRVDGQLQLAGDPDRLKQVLLNLAGNAVAFTGEAGHIELRAARRGDSMRIEVADDGAGIDPADLPRLFERFYRGDKARARRADGGGNGLGLAIVRAIVEAHGGTIAADSTLGRGTTITIDLPSRRTGRVVAGLKASPPPAAGSVILARDAGDDG